MNSTNTTTESRKDQHGRSICTGGRFARVAGKVFRERVAIAKPDRRRWSKLLLEAVDFGLVL